MEQHARWRDGDHEDQSKGLRTDLERGARGRRVDAKAAFLRSFTGLLATSTASSAEAGSPCHFSPPSHLPLTAKPPLPFASAHHQLLFHMVTAIPVGLLPILPLIWSDREDALVDILRAAVLQPCVVLIGSEFYFVRIVASSAERPFQAIWMPMQRRMNAITRRMPWAVEDGMALARFGAYA
jgi:hypothetical protein